eukprot:1161046-Pelagomonas_calceolata.AAC.2
MKLLLHLNNTRKINQRAPSLLEAEAQHFAHHMVIPLNESMRHVAMLLFGAEGSQESGSLTASRCSASPGEIFQEMRSAGEELKPAAKLNAMHLSNTNTERKGFHSCTAYKVNLAEAKKVPLTTQFIWRTEAIHISQSRHVRHVDSHLVKIIRM